MSSRSRPMFGAIQRYVHRRRRGLVRSFTFLYGSYVLSAYIIDRLDEMKDKMLRNRLARENLRRRFQSTHDDACFTIMALIPTLASQILEEMDVEALTSELQSMSRASRSQHLPLPQSVSELGSSSEVNSDAGSASFSSYTGSTFIVDRTSESLSASVISTSTLVSQDGHNDENPVPSASPRTKNQLWNEVKILALTRTLTTLYTTTLLSLFTAVQLNLLGRCRYIDSVRESDRVERGCDELTEDEDDERLDAISEGTELRFLTLSWWVLHLGWKDVAARVRSSVESVFDDVSLKAKLSPSELFTLIMDVRRRVEMDDTRSKLGERFLSSLLPPTPETIAHVLAQGGVPRVQPTTDVPDSLATSHGTLDDDPQFTALLAQTKCYLSGPDFAHALGCALDRATEVLMDGLRARVFVATCSAVNVPDTQVQSKTDEEVKIRLAGLLPGLARWCQLALNATPNELVDNVMAVREVSALEAIIISDYGDRFPAMS